MRILMCLATLFCIMSSALSTSVQAIGSTPTLQAKSAIAIDSENGLILFNQDADDLYEVGSVSKLLAVYVTLKAVSDSEDLDVNSIVPISDQAYSLSQDYDIGNVPLRQDYNYTVNELVESIAINLASGSSLALAEFIGGTEEDFVLLMEEQLTDWGLEDYDLVNATGLEAEDGQVNAMSAEVAAAVAYHLVNDFPHFVDYSQKAAAVFKPNTDDSIEMMNYNQMLDGKPYEYDGVLGLMPGNSEQDGSAFVSYANIDDFGVITVVLGSEDEDSRYEETTELLDYSYRAYMKEQIIESGQEVTQIGSIAVHGGESTWADLVFGEDLSLVVPIIDTAPRLEYVFQENDQIFQGNNFVQAPIEAMQELGRLSVNSVGIDQAFLTSTKGNSVAVVQQSDLNEATWYIKGWQSFSDGVSHSWESMRRFFVDVFN